MVKLSYSYAKLSLLDTCIQMCVHSKGSKLQKRKERSECTFNIGSISNYSRDIFYEIISIRHKTANYSKNLCPNMIDLIWFPNQITRYDLIESRKSRFTHIRIQT